MTMKNYLRLVAFLGLSLNLTAIEASHSGLPGVSANLQIAPLTIDLTDLAGDGVKQAGLGTLSLDVRHDFNAGFGVGGTVKVADSNQIMRQGEVFAVLPICTADHIDECQGGPYQVLIGAVFMKDVFGKSASLEQVGGYVKIEEGGSGEFVVDRNHRVAFGMGAAKLTYPDGFETKALSLSVEGERKFLDRIFIKGSLEVGGWGVIDNEIQDGAYHASMYGRAEASIGYFIVNNRLLASFGATASAYRHSHQTIIPGEYSQDALPEKSNQALDLVPNVTISYSPSW